MVRKLKIFLQPIPLVLLIMMAITVAAHEYIVLEKSIVEAVLWGVGTGLAVITELMLIDFCFKGFRW